MEVKFADTFFKSLRNIARHETWWYKTYEFFRYDIRRFFRNVWKFRKEIHDFRPWDYSYNLKLFRRSLVLTADNMEKYGNEVPESRDKKIQKMRRAIQLMDHILEGDFIRLAEQEIGREVIHRPWSFKPDETGKFSTLEFNETEKEKKLNKEIYDKSDEIEKAQWKELWTIIQGQDHENFKATDPDDREKSIEEYEDWYDGSGMKGWWD